MGGLPWGFKIPDAADGGHHMFLPDLFMVVMWTYHAMYSTFDVSCYNSVWALQISTWTILISCLHQKKGLLSANTVYSIAYKQLGLVNTKS